MKRYTIRKRTFQNKKKNTLDLSQQLFLAICCFLKIEMINEKEYYNRKTVSNLKMLEKSKNEGNMKKETWF